MLLICEIEDAMGLDRILHWLIKELVFAAEEYPTWIWELWMLLLRFLSFILLVRVIAWLNREISAEL